MKAKLLALFHVLASKEARAPEVALARIIMAGLGVKLGVNLVDYFK